MNNKYKMFAVAGIGSLLATFETSSINVALPSLSQHFHLEVDTVSWVALIYTITISPTLLIFAALAAKYGFKRLYLTGFSLFSVGCLVAGFANGFELMLAGRVLQGIGASMNLSLGPAVITHAFPRGERGKGMGLVAIIVGLGLLSGPLVGGYLVSIDWRLIFLAPLAFSWAPLLIVPRIPEWRHDKRHENPISVMSGGILFIAVASFLYAMNMVNEQGAGLNRIVSFLSVTVLAGAVFIYRERSPRTNLIGYDIFKNRNFSVSVALMFFAFVATSSAMILVPFFVERELNLSPRDAGLFLAVMPTIMLLLAPISGRIADKIGSRWPCALGLLIVTVGAYMLRNVDPAEGVWSLLLPLIVFGVGMGIFGTPNSSDMMGSVGEDQREIASGALATTRTLSFTFGIAVSTALYVFWSNRVGTLGAYQNVFSISTASAGLGFIVSLFRQPGRR